MSSEEKFDAIVVGGGLAGSAAALTMARAGLDVMMVERGKFCGSKNSSGGRLYGHSLEKLIPNFAAEAPIERKITQERLSLMTEGGALSFQYGSDKLENLKYPSYSVLRSKFDKWLADKAEEAGVMLTEGFLVDELVVEDGKVVEKTCTWRDVTVESVQANIKAAEPQQEEPEDDEEPEEGDNENE